MGVVRVIVSDQYTEAMHRVAAGAILTEIDQGCVHTYYLRIPEMDDCEGDVYIVHRQPTYSPFAPHSLFVDQIWIVPHVECVR